VFIAAMFGTRKTLGIAAMSGTRKTLGIAVTENM
jgi:hypothetical protein